MNECLITLRNAHTNKNVEDCEKGMTKLTETWNTISTKMYQQTSQEQTTNQEQPKAEEQKKTDDNIQDVEYEEVK